MELDIDLEQEKKDILSKYRGLLRTAKRSKSSEDRKKIRKAFDVALDAHSDMRRKSGEPYIYHPIAVARIVAEEIGLGTTSIVCALLHDTVEDTDITLEDIEVLFGEKERKIIKTLLKYDAELYKIDVSGYEDVGSMPKGVFEERKQNAVFIDRDNYLLLDLLSAV